MNACIDKGKLQRLRDTNQDHRCVQWILITSLPDEKLVNCTFAHSNCNSTSFGRAEGLWKFPYPGFVVLLVLDRIAVALHVHIKKDSKHLLFTTMSAMVSSPSKVPDAYACLQCTFLQGDSV
jgi:hypothetical protein